MALSKSGVTTQKFTTIPLVAEIFLRRISKRNPILKLKLSPEKVFGYFSSGT
jgi:hypothetical protein